MLPFAHSLTFPQLVREDHETEAPWRHGTAFLYRIDWTQRDAKLLKNGSGFTPPRPVDVLPDPYENWLQSLRFVLDPRYLQEIERNALRAYVEWGMSRYFDTAIRDMCLGPAKEHVYVAMSLLNDCVYDPDTTKLYRGPRQSIIRPALIYRFWQGHTGNGLVPYNAGLHILRERVDAGNIPDIDEAKETAEFLDAITKHRDDVSTRWRAQRKAEQG